MELRHLRYFVAVAEELSFTRASARLHIGQPPLSQQIQALEREIGAQLLDRSRRRVQLTEAGRLFLHEAYNILAQSQGAAEIARRASRGEVGQLRLGFTSSTPFTSLFTRAIKLYRTTYPHVTLQFQVTSTMRQIAAIDAGTLDIGFIRPPEAPIPDTIRLQVLKSYPLALITPAGHRLARKARVSIRDLAGEDFVMFSRDEGTTLYPQTFRLCREAGFEPKIVIEAKEASTIIGLVAAGCGITILPELYHCIRIKGLCYKPIHGQPAATDLVLASRCSGSTPVIDAFLAMATQAARADE
jgi:DNA-binding transcriptional LysR family regulator